MTVRTFAEKFRLKVSRDECGDEIIPGKGGQLYFDDGALCLMVLDGKPKLRSKWTAIGGKLWLGDISPDARGRRVQDVKIVGIPLENARLAIQMVRARQRRILSTEELQMRRAIINNARAALSNRPSLPLEPPGNK